MNVENMDNFIDLVTPEVINLVSPSPLPTIDWETPMFGCNDNICTCYNLDSPTYYNNSEPSEVINLVSPCPSPLPTTIDWETPDWKTPMIGLCCKDNICTCYNLDTPTYLINSPSLLYESDSNNTIDYTKNDDVKDDQDINDEEIHKGGELLSPSVKTLKKNEKIGKNKKNKKK